MFNEEDRKWLYGQFKDNGYDTGSYEDFVKSLDNEEDFKWWHEQATGLGLEVGDINEFGSLFRPTPGTEQVERVEQPARTVDPQAAAEGRSLFNQMTAARRGTSSLSDAPQVTQQYMEQNPVKGGSRQREQLMEQLGATADDQNFIQEYDRRYTKYQQDTDNDLTGPEQQADKAWLDENNQRYREAKQKVGEIQGRINLMDKPEDLERIAGKKKDIQDKYPALFNPGGYRPDPSRRLDPNDPEIPMYKSANEIYGMAEQALNQGSKYDPGYEGNWLEQAWTAARQFAEGGLNNIDTGSLTFGASEGIALNNARKVGDKSNEIVNATLKDMGYTESGVNKLLQSVDEDGKKLASLGDELNKESAELASMKATLDDMQKSGASEGRIRAYAREYNKRINAYNKRVTSELEPLLASYEKSANEYETLMSAIDAAVEGGLTDGEKAILDALEEFTDAKMKRAEDVSIASAAGAGAEQSAEFMLDFILTGGLAKAGTKAATKLTARRVMKKFGAEAAAKVVRPSLGAQIATDAVVAAARTTAMFPRNLAAYGEQLTQMTGKDNLGRYNFDRSHLNAALNTALTQYIEYWSEGFGEYFGAGEQALFRKVTKAAPRTAIGKTLGQYRGSIGKYLDYGKFDGMFNEMLEEVVGSSLNSLAGWMSGDRIGDQEALKDFFSGEQLATLALSFLPMSAISARTNIKAYNKMKNRYNDSVAVLNPFLNSGAISREELEGLVSNIAEKTPEEIKDQIVKLTDKARAANGGYLPQNFTQSLLGYVEGSFAMSMNNEQWEDSQEKLGVVNAYTEQYSNPDERNAYDLAQLESEARSAAMQAGFDENMLDLDSYSIARHAQSLQQTNPQQAQVLLGYAVAKSANQGLRDGYDEETRQLFNEIERGIQENSVNGNVIRATAPDGNLVFITSQDASVGVNGNLSTPTGADGLVSYVDPNGRILQAKASTFTGVTSTPTEYYILDQESNFFDARRDAFDIAQQTISPTGKARALNANIGNTVFFRMNGIYEPMQVDRLTQDNTNVVVSGDPKFLNGLATMLGLQSPGGQSMELPIETIWPMLATNDDGSLATKLPEAGTTQASAETTSQPQPSANTIDGRPIANVQIDEENGEVYFTYQDDPNGMLQVMGLDEFRQKTGQAEVPAQEEMPAAPAEQPQTPAAEETPAEEAPQSKIPVDKDGNKIYDAPGVEPIDAYDDMYSTPGLTEEDVDEWVIAQSEEAEKNRNPKIKKGQSLADWGAAKAEANRVADFWKQFRDIAEERAKEREEARKQEAERQKEIEKYGVDTRGFDLTPQTVEEAVANYLGNNEGIIDLDDAKKEVFGKSGRIPSELFRHVGNGGILTKKGGRTIADVANDIVGEYEGQLPIEQDAVRDLIIDYLARYTKTEMRDMIFNNRLAEALAEREQQNGASSETETAEEVVDDLPEAEEETIPAEEAVEEAPEGTAVPEVEEPVAEPAEPEPATAEEDVLLENETQEIRDAVDAIVSGKDTKKREVKSTLPDDFTIGGMDVNSYIRSRYDRFKAPLEKRREEIRKEYVAYRTRVENEARADILRNNPHIKEDNPYLPDYVSEEANKRLKNDEQFNALDAQIKAIDEEIGNYQSRRYNALAAIEEVYESQKPTETPENNAPESSETPGNSVPSQEEETATAPGVPASAAEIRNVVEARAYFENLYGKGRRADNSVRVWELTHKKPVTRNENGGLKSQMAMALEGVSGLSQEEAAELVTLGTQLAEDFINDGFVKFPQFFKTIVETFGDGIRPFTKSIYLGASANVSDETADQMDDRKTVRTFDTSIDINDISDEQSDTTGIQEPGESVSEPVSVPAGEQVPGAEGEVSGTDTGAGVEDVDSTGTGEVAGEPSEEGRLGTGGTGVAGAGERGNRGNRGTGAGRRGAGRPRSGSGSRGEGVSDTGNTEPGEDTSRGIEATEEAVAEAENKAYEAEKERIKDETDTNKLKALKHDLKAKISEITEKINLDKARMAGQLRAVIERLRELFSNNANKTEKLDQEKVPYQTISDPEGSHAFGSVVPSAAADAMRDAIHRLEKEEGKNVADFVKDELGYSSLDELFSGEEKSTGLSSEQVDSVGLAIHQMKNGKMFIVGDMTGVGKGRQGAALIRWAKRNGKKVLFVTQSADLFSDMYGDLEDIGGLDRSVEKKPTDKKSRKPAKTTPLPFIINDDAGANITRKNTDSDDVTILVRHPGKAEYDKVYKSGSDELPTVARGEDKGRQYDFVMMTYSQAQSARTAAAERKLNWIKQYAKDAIVIMDESHNAAGDTEEGKKRSNRSIYFEDIVKGAGGITFMSATFAKRPGNMLMYALRSSMGDAQMTAEDMILAISEYGIPMQEILASSLFKTGEMVRRERDFTDVKTHWQEPSETFTEDEIKQSRDTFDLSMGVVNTIIEFQRATVDRIIKKMNEDFAESNALAEAAAAMGGKGTIREYTATPYSSQVSNVANLMFYSIKARKAAQMAIEQIKKGEKPVIAVENTLESYLKDIDGDTANADFSFVLSRGLARSLNYRFKETVKEYNKEKGKVEVVKEESRVTDMGSIEPKMGPEALSMLNDVREAINQYSKSKDIMPLMLSPIDYIKHEIEAAGYKCGEITGRKLQLVQAPDGTYHTETIPSDKDRKKKAIAGFNNGTLDAMILNTAGATGISLHASKRFKDQRKRTMIILQPARDPNTEVQVRGRVDRTGQVSRAEYFYITSPIPAERKVIMMLKQKLASLDANAVGTEKVSSNRVDAEDMDNKYGDEVARQFLADHPEINEQLDDSKQIEQKKGEWVGRDGLMYDLLIAIQRLSCADQEMILEELQNSYKDQIEYLNQNGINDLVTTTMNLEAVTIDSGLFIKGKDNESMSEFAHDTNIERVEVNVINKPLRSSDINARMKKLGALNEDGTIDDDYGEKVRAVARRYADDAKIERVAKHRAAEDELEAELKKKYPKTDLQTEEEYQIGIDMIPQLATLKEKNKQDEERFTIDMDKQTRAVAKAAQYCKPGMPMFVPLTDELGANAPMSYGRFIGFKVPKDGRPKGIKAVFAVKDSRASIELPVVSKADVIQNIIDTTYGSLGFGGSSLRDIGGDSWDSSITDEDRRKARDEWWDKMIPKDTNRQIRYMVTGNILQACGSLGKYKGSIVTYTRKDTETGEITVDRGMLLAEDFDPENFMVRSAVTKEDVWDGYDQIRDDVTNISVQREGNYMVVRFDRRGKEQLSKHPIMKDDAFKELVEDKEIQAYSRDQLRAYVAEKNVEKVLEHLYKVYGFTKGHLFIMPDSTERVDAIVYTDRPYNEVIKDFQDKYNADQWDIDRKIKNAVKQYKMDVNNEDLKQRIREMVQLRQAFLRKRYAKGESSRLAWQVIIEDEAIEQAKDDKDYRDKHFAMREAIKEELAARGIHGNSMHFESGKTSLDTIIKTFNELNKDKTNAKIAKKVFDIAKKLKLDVFLNEKAKSEKGGMSTRTGGQTAGDSVEYNLKYMNADWITDQMKADTILHELIHTATEYARMLVADGNEHLLLQDNPEAYDAINVLNALYSAIKKNTNFVHVTSADYGDYYTDYGVSYPDSRELLTEAGSNEAFREDLKKVIVAPKLIAGLVSFTDVTNIPDYKGRTQTAWDVIEEQLNVLLDNFGQHAYTEAWRGTGFGERSYSTVEPTEQRIVDAEQKAANELLDRMEDELHFPIHRVSREEMPRGHKSDKGYYNPSTGEMTICMDNVTDERDAIATVLHETVGHHGLRKLFGDRFNDAMARIYAALDQKGKTWVNGYIARHPNADNTRAVEEYLSHLAESGDFKNTVWDNIRRIIGRIVDALFGTNGFLLTDNELNYILRASYENLKNPNWLNTVEGRAFDTLLKRQLGINETDPNKPTDPQGPDAGKLYRDGDTGVANDDYNSLVDSWENKMLTENQDADRPVRIGMDKVMKEKGIKSISEDEDYVTRHNLASSRAESEAHEFELFRFTPLMDQVRAIQSRLLGKKATAADREQAYQRILDYMYAVSGLERNASKNAEIEQAKQAKLADAAAAGITDPAKLAEIEKKYDDMKRDWSGLTSLMGMSKDNWQAAETAAQGMISAFEGAIGDKAALDELWNRVRACTDFSLEHAYQHGLLTREEFERLHGTASQPRMWEYYLPLRGFSETTAEEQFSYETFTNPSRGNVVVKKMNGRWTQADNPLANILNIAETEIVQGNDNWAKQALYRFTLNAGDNTLLSASEPWFVKNPATGKWSMAFPDPGETLEEFEERMKALRALDDPLAKKGRRGLKLENIMANKAHRNEHAIHLKVGGIDKMIWVNGNPALAKAVSGIGRAQNWQWLRRASRALSNLFTTYSLDFTAKNLIRDTVYSNIALHVKEDKAYRHQYYKNWIANFGYGAFAFPMVRLAAEWDSGKLQQKEKAGTLTKREQDFLNFMRDGGQTGYTIINSVNQIKKDLEKQMRSAGGRPGTVPILGWYAKAVKTLNEGFELLTRFTAYQTSRDMGRSGQRAASDAKEISVNFNRRGAQSGDGVWGNIAAYLGATHYFYNAGVQGFDNFLGLFKKKPYKMSTITAGFVIMGIATPFINSMLAGLIGGGDGDDDWYWNLPEWVRRNNLVIGTGKWYVALPLPVEFRAPYGIGDIAGAAFAYDKYPNRHFGNVAGGIITTASGILPVNPIEGYTGNGNLGDAALRAVAPDAGMFFVDWATNRDYTGRPLWKENPFSDTVPKSQGAYASTPKGIVAACQKLAEVSNGSIDIAPGVVRDFMNNYGGGFFRAAEDVSKLLFTDEERPRRWDNVPFFSGFTGHIDEDRSNSFAQGALYDYKKLSEDNVKSMNAILNTDDVTSAVLYDEPESLYEREGVTVLQKAKIKRMLDSKDYALGKMYREGMDNKYKMKQSLKDGHWYKSRDIERKGVNALRQEWKDLRDQWAKMPEKTEEQKSAKAEMDLKVQEAWHLYYDAMGDLAEKLMDYEYNK